MVVGAGVFGVTGALELARRGWAVTLVDAGPVPHPDAASTDLSKVVRAEYGGDDLYVDLMVACLPEWRAWNERWGDELFHEDGLLLLTDGETDPDGFEATSAAALRTRGFPVERLEADEVAHRFPAWTPHGPGFWNPVGGWAESSRVVERLLAEAVDAGVATRWESVSALAADDDGVAGVVTASGEVIEADVTVVASGSWSVPLVPGLDDLVSVTGQPVVHLRPEDPSAFASPGFGCWAVDVARLGWYGFPLHPTGVVKVAHHGPGVAVDGPGPHDVPADWDDRVRAMLRRWLPGLADAPIVHRRLCRYTDTADGDYLVDWHPDVARLVVATGGSGHAFKFAPLLGAWIADAVEESGSVPDRFRWRRGGGGGESSRSRTDA